MAGQKVHNPKDDAPLTADAKERTSSWFRGAGLGVFIHWDHASQQGLETSWALVGGVLDSKGAIPAHVEDYHRSASTFDPDNWDPGALAELAVAAGATYAVFTARHHSGWAAWPSQVSDRTVAQTPYGRHGGDLVREYVDACRAAGLKVGLYYSLSDWNHELYPRFTDEMRPYQHKDYPRPSRSEWAIYRQYMKDQLTELLTWYGPIDLLWFDGEWERSEAEWDTADLVAHVRSLSPTTVVNDRLIGHGDYRTPEQFIPAQPLLEAWECCMTMCTSWGFVPDDDVYKSSYEILRTLTEVVAKGGNLLLNVSPKGDGSIPERQQAILQELAEWMSVNAEAVIGVEPGLEAWQFHGPTTRRSSIIYLIALATPYESMVVRGIPVRRVTSVKRLGDERELAFRFRTELQDVFLEDPLGELTIEVVPSPTAAPPIVYAVELAGSPATVS